MSQCHRVAQDATAKAQEGVSHAESWRQSIPEGENHGRKALKRQRVRNILGTKWSQCGWSLKSEMTLVRCLDSLLSENLTV